MANVTWPKGPFYIVKNDSSYSALTAISVKDSNHTTSFSPLGPTAMQLWVAIELPTVELPTTVNGPYPVVLLNVGAQGPLALVADISANQTLVVLKSTSDSPISKLAWMWSNNEIYSTYSSNLYITESSGKTGLGTPTEGVSLALLLELGYYTLPADAPDTSITTPGGTLAGFVGGTGETILLDNSGSSTSYEGEATLTFEATNSTTFSQGSSYTDTVTKSVTASLGLNLSGPLSKTLKIGLDAKGATTYTHETSNTVSISTDTTQSQQRTYSLTCQTSVPAGSKYQYSIQPNVMAFVTSYDFAVDLHSSLPGNTTYPIHLTGNYTGSNLVTSTLTVKKVTSAAPADQEVISQTIIRH